MKRIVSRLALPAVFVAMLAGSSWAPASAQNATDVLFGPNADEQWLTAGYDTYNLALTTEMQGTRSRPEWWYIQGYGWEMDNGGPTIHVDRIDFE